MLGQRNIIVTAFILPLLIGAVFGIFGRSRSVEAQSPVWPVAQAIYLNVNTGNDNNACTQQAPCKTIARGTALAIAHGLPTQANAVNVYLSPGRYHENIVLYPDVNLIAIEGGWRTLLGTSAIDTITANGPAFTASPDPFPGVVLQNFLIDASFNWDFSAVSANAFLFLNNSAPSSTTGDTFKCGPGQQCAIITTSGYFEDNTLTLDDWSPQTFGTTIFSNVAITAAHDTLVAQWLASPFVSDTVDLTANAQSLTWDSQASPFLGTTLSRTCIAGGTVPYSTGDMLPSSLNFGCSGALYQTATVDGILPIGNLEGCTPGQLITGGPGAPFGLACNNTTIGQSGWTQQTNATTATTGLVTLTAPQYAPPFQTVQASLTGTLTIAFPNTFSAFWDISTEAVTFGGHSIVLECGTGVTSKTVTTNVLERCYCDGSNNFFCNP
jgi:hypothetical protein